MRSAVRCTVVEVPGSTRTNSSPPYLAARSYGLDWLLSTAAAWRALGPDYVAVLIIDGLEMVQVRHNHTQVFLQPFRASDLSPEGSSSVRRLASPSGICAGQPFDRFIGFLELAVLSSAVAHHQRQIVRQLEISVSNCES